MSNLKTDPRTGVIVQGGRTILSRYKDINPKRGDKNNQEVLSQNMSIELNKETMNRIASLIGKEVGKELADTIIKLKDLLVQQPTVIAAVQDDSNSASIIKNTPHISIDSSIIDAGLESLPGLKSHTSKSLTKNQESKDKSISKAKSKLQQLKKQK